MNFKQKVSETIKKFDLLKKGERVLIGVSGGPDSIALLYCLNSLKQELNLKLYIAHLDHRLRKDSYKDAEFVRQVARKLNLPFMVSQIDVRKTAKKGSLEELSRKARHKFFKMVAKKYSLGKIALGHNRDDQAETVLMRILRGSGLYGLAAIAPKRIIEGLVFVRPLIEIPRSGINSFLKQKKIKARIDTSNFESIFLRNKIRSELIPILESKFGRNIRDKLSTLAEIVSLDYEYLANEAEEKLKEVVVSKRKSWVCLDLKKLMMQHVSMQRMILRLCIKSLLGSTRKFDFRHWQEIADLISSRPKGAIVDLPKNLSVKTQEGKLKLYIRKG